MSLPVRTNAFGYHEFKPPFRDSLAYTQKSDGYQWFEDKLMGYRVEHICSRGDHVTSKKRFIPGTSTLWRDPHPYARSVLTTKYNVGKVRSDEGWYTVVNTGICSSQYVQQGYNPNAFFNEGVRWESELENEALAKAIAKIKDQKAALGEALAESTKTYSMIVDSGRTLLQAALAVKRGNAAQAWSLLKDGRSVVRRGADLYCQYQYGWRPLMSDLKGMYDLFTEQLKQAQLIKAVAYSQRQSVEAIDSGDCHRQGTGYRQCKVVLWGYITDPVLSLPEKVGLANPLSLAWELVPYSFVVDWFIPVGKTLDAFVPPKGVSFVGGTATTFGKIDVQFAQKFGANTEVITPKDGTMQIESSQRRVYSGGSWPIPGFYAINPFNQKYKHGFEALALLIQRLTR